MTTLTERPTQDDELTDAGIYAMINDRLDSLEAKMAEAIEALAEVTAMLADVLPQDQRKT